MHDLARSVGKTDFMVLDHDITEGNMSQVYHLSVANNVDIASFPTDLFEAKHLRTLLFLFPTNILGVVPYFLPVNFIYLRVLNLSGCVKNVHESISALICLRYLDLSCTSIETLPRSICNLCNLQTLNLSSCNNLISLPLGMSSITGLRHLNILGCERLTCLPARIGNLVHLQTLPLYIVGMRIGESITELGSLNLRGELSIRCLEYIRDADEAKMANLREKKHLQLLRLQWGTRNEGQKLKLVEGSTSSAANYSKNPYSPISIPLNDGHNVDNVLEYLQPHENLRMLYVKGIQGIDF